MNKNLPSKKIIAFGIIAFGAVIAILISRYIESNPAVFSFLDKPKSAALSYSGSADSLENNPNSNIADISTPTPESSVGSTTSSSTPNASDLFSQDLFTKFMTIQNSGDITDAGQQQSLVQNLSQEVQSAFSYKQYSMNGLQVINNPSQDDIRFYASSFATLQLNFLQKLQDSAPKIRNNSDVAVKIYADIAKSLYELKVPSDIQADHLAIVNNMSGMAQIFQTTNDYKKDPVSAISAIQQYSSIKKSQQDALSTIAEYLRSNGIIFTTDEDGNFWNNF